MLTRDLRRAAAWLLCALLVPLYAPTASAEEARTGRRIEEVIVTAERREASIQDTSISITAFTADFLDDFGIRNQEDLQNYVPATTIQPYDSTIRGVGRNFRALGGDPGVSTYLNGIYSEDLLAVTAQTFFDVERIEVLRGPQGTLYGRNAVGGAINILYKEPTYEREGMFKVIGGNFGAEEYYGAVSGPIIQDRVAGRLTYAHRDRNGVIDDIGTGGDLDGLGTNNFTAQLKWNPTDTIELNLRQNWLDVNRSFGGANGAGLVVLNESGQPNRVTDALVPGWRRIDPNNTDPANFYDNDFNDPNGINRTFTDPNTGQAVLAQRNRAGIDYGDFDGFQNAAASLDGFNNTSAGSAARYNECVFPDDIDGNDVCAATNGLNNEEFELFSSGFNVSWDAADWLQIKYLFGFTDYSYERTTDDDNTGSLVHDRQFYVNHEAQYRSHELQAFMDINENVTVTSGIFFYNAEIDQRGDFYSSVGEARYRNAYVDNTALSPEAALIAAGGDQATADALTGLSASLLAFGGAPMVNLYSAKRSCNVDNPAASCERNYSVENSNEALEAQGLRNDNLQTSAWLGDDGTNRLLDVRNGPRTDATDLLYTTETKRESFAAYTQTAWDINETFSLTLGLRYAEDKVTAEENLWRYSETGAEAGGFLALYGGLAAVNIVNGGLVDSNNDGIFETPTELNTNAGIPFALSVYRPFQRTDKEWDWRINLDHHITDNAMLYYSATKGHRSGGYNLVFFSTTPTYDPEELISYELGYKTDWLDNTLQLNGSFYYYDYENIHSVVSEVTSLGGLSNSVLSAPGARVTGAEAEFTWLATDSLTLGGNVSYTPSKYTKSLVAGDLAGVDRPPSIFPDQADLVQDIKGNQLLQVPEWKSTLWASYRFNLPGGAKFDTNVTWAYTDKVYYSPFESESESADPYDRVDLRGTWTSANDKFIVSAFVNNVFNDVGVLQVLRDDEQEFFRHNAGTTVPRHYGLELSYIMGNY